MNASSGSLTIASIVEGEGERDALPVLLRRIAAEVGVKNLVMPKPQRERRGNITRGGGIEKAVSAAAARVQGAGGILVLIDADADCPARLGPDLLQRAKAAQPGARISVVLAMHEFEAWFLAALPSLAGRERFPKKLSQVRNPEFYQDCKGELERFLPNRQSYRPVPDQKPLASIFDMTMAREHAESFDKFYRDIAWLLGVG
ncbi:MAG TPA: DUF4276 family protein [Trebonia sp.]|nr:DUF4276 family protein [Trebonia sp.]